MSKSVAFRVMESRREEAEAQHKEAGGGGASAEEGWQRLQGGWGGRCLSIGPAPSEQMEHGSQGLRTMAQSKEKQQQNVQRGRTPSQPQNTAQGELAEMDRAGE